MHWDSEWIIGGQSRRRGERAHADAFLRFFVSSLRRFFVFVSSLLHLFVIRFINYFVIRVFISSFSISLPIYLRAPRPATWCPLPFTRCPPRHITQPGSQSSRRLCNTRTQCQRKRQRSTHESKNEKKLGAYFVFACISRVPFRICPIPS